MIEGANRNRSVFQDPPLRSGTRCGQMRGSRVHFCRLCTLEEGAAGIEFPHGQQMPALIQWCWCRTRNARSCTKGHKYERRLLHKEESYRNELAQHYRLPPLLIH